MTDSVQQQITWLRCFDDDEADHVGAARCANTMQSQQTRIKLLEKVLEAARPLNIGFIYDKEMAELTSAIADCEPSPDRKPLTERNQG